MKMKTGVGELQMGMYVCELDRPWLGTPFVFQGFRITNEDELRQLRELCAHVWVDAEKGVAPRPRLGLVAAGEGEPVHSSRPRPYLTPVEDEFPRARAVFADAKRHLEKVFDEVRLGHAFDVADARAAISGLVETVMRNPNALLLLSTLQARDTGAAGHSLNVSVFSLVFGRFLNLGEEALADIGLGAMLHDIGEIRLPEEVLSARGQAGSEAALQMQTHTRLGADLLEQTAGIPRSAVEIARAHHERAAGNGYPQRLSGEDIPFFARIVGLADVYESLTAGREGRVPMNPTDVLKSMYDWRDRLFEAALVQKFIECLGIYPVGSVVKLSTGEVGVVIADNPGKRLLPKLMLVRSRAGKPVQPPRIIDLALYVSAETGRRYEIKSVHSPDEFGVDLSGLVLREMPIPTRPTGGA